MKRIHKAEQKKDLVGVGLGLGLDSRVSKREWINWYLRHEQKREGNGTAGEWTDNHWTNKVQLHCGMRDLSY